MYAGEKIKGHWITVALFSFLVAGLLGLVLRIGFITGFPDWIHYRFILHAHSHVAMMGWLFSAFFIVILYLFRIDFKKYRKLFWGIQFSVIGMLVFFPIQGYAFGSIFFTSMHLILSYIFMFRVNKELTKAEINDSAILFLKTAFLFFFISTLGTWALGPLMLSAWKGTAVYYAAVQFFLHFQFNGWFIFGGLAFFLKFLQDHKISYNTNLIKLFYRLLVLSCILTYALAVSWSTPDNFIFWTNSAGVIIQLIALLTFLSIIAQIRKRVKQQLKKLTFILWNLSLISLTLKILAQSFVAIPALAKISYTIHNFVIGFIHLILLGIISFFVIGLFHEKDLFTLESKWKKMGVLLISIGILGSEVILFGQGIMLWFELGYLDYYYGIIALISSLIPLGLIFYIAYPNKKISI